MKEYPGSVCQQGGAASPLAQQLLRIVSVFLVILLIVVLGTTNITQGSSCSSNTAQSQSIEDK